MHLDEDRFDDLSRRLARGLSRRQALAGLTAGVAAALGLRATRDAGAQVTQVYCGNPACASNPGGCKPGCVCYVYTDAVGQVTNSRCRPPGTCSPGTQAGGPPTTTTSARPTTTSTTTVPRPQPRPRPQRRHRPHRSTVPGAASGHATAQRGSN